MTEKEYINEDIEELRGLFNLLKEFLPEVIPLVKDLINTVMEALSGEKLGKDVADFYKNLIDSGMDKNLAAELTKNYLANKIHLLSRAMKDVTKLNIEKENEEKQG